MLYQKKIAALSYRDCKFIGEEILSTFQILEERPFYIKNFSLHQSYLEETLIPITINQALRLHQNAPEREKLISWCPTPVGVVHGVFNLVFNTPLYQKITIACTLWQTSIKVDIRLHNKNNTNSTASEYTDDNIDLYNALQAQDRIAMLNILIRSNPKLLKAIALCFIDLPELAMRP